MTPKEKAFELYKMYNNLIIDEVIEMKMAYLLMSDKMAKQSALIAVNEILNDVMFYWYSPIEDMPKDMAYFVTVRKYWEDVKTEIEKL